MLARGGPTCRAAVHAAGKQRTAAAGQQSSQRQGGECGGSRSCLARVGRSPAEIRPGIRPIDAVSEFLKAAMKDRDFLEAAADARASRRSSSRARPARTAVLARTHRSPGAKTQVPGCEVRGAHAKRQSAREAACFLSHRRSGTVASVFRPSARDADNLAVPVRQPDEEVRGIPAPPRRPTQRAKRAARKTTVPAREVKRHQPVVPATTRTDGRPTKRRKIAPRSSLPLTRRDRDNSD